VSLAYTVKSLMYLEPTSADRHAAFGLYC